MLEGKSERLEFQKMLSSPHRKNRSEQKQKEKKNWLSCHALEKFELSLNENQESQKKMLRK